MKKLHLRLLSIIMAAVTMFTMVPALTASAAENYDGGWAISNSAQNVYANASYTSVIGSIDAKEGITVLNQFDNVAYIEYSTASGAKRGYLINPDLNTNHLATSCVAKVNTTSTLYYGANTSAYQASGTVYSGEYVAVIAKNGDWAYVEYNTTSGRKRGYMSYSNLTCYNRPSYFSDLYTYTDPINSLNISETVQVRSGPSETYPVIGSVDASDNPINFYYRWYYRAGQEFVYIEYWVAGTTQKKSGFILIDVY